MLEKIANGVWKLVLGEPEELTPVKYRKFDINKAGLESLLQRDVVPEVFQALEWKKTKRGIAVTLPMETTEDIFGFGLQLKSLNMAGRKRRIRVNSDPPADTGESHAPAPFYVSSAGYGLFADTFRYADFFMGTNSVKGRSAGKTEVNQIHQEFSESALYALKRAGEKRTIIIDIPGVNGITLYIFSGILKEAVQRYNLFSGGGPLVPMWGLGVWYRTYGGSDQDKVIQMAEAFRTEHIPVDVFGLEPGWHSHSYSCTYEWSYLFPEPEKMIEALKTQHYKINLWEHAFVYPAAPIYQDLLPYSGDYEVWNGLVPDFADEKAVEIFSDYHEKNLVDKGIMGFKLDECDNSDYNPSNWSFPEVSTFPSGMDGEQMHNGIGLLYQNLLDNIYRKKNLRTLSQVRASGALAAPLPFVLYSDLYDHRDFIRGIVTSGFSGMLWSPEVRSCENGGDFLRRVQTVIFSAQALLNCWRIPNPPWKQVDVEKNLRNEYMKEEVYYTQEIRRLLQLRMSLLPYLYSAFMEYHLYGTPPVRAVVLDYPEDSKAAVIDDQYLFGDSMMVCPLTIEDGTNRTVWLPKGTWHNFFSGEIFEGGREYQISAELEEIPVFVKNGALIPLAEPVECVSPDTIFWIRVKSFGKGEQCFTLYEDDFESLDAENGAYNQVLISRDQEGGISWERRGTQPIRYELEI
ncbi:MAG: glycoside hydrolase family 31 protein [Lacrimispora sp.]|uniref:TIM-barrel domain-containing protein n=1 Tax=Lacrimispora sp. TaxID=2719234 RepID=UPI0039E4C705